MSWPSSRAESSDALAPSRSTPSRSTSVSSSATIPNEGSATVANRERSQPRVGPSRLSPLRSLHGVFDGLHRPRPDRLARRLRREHLLLLRERVDALARRTSGLLHHDELRE